MPTYPVRSRSQCAALVTLAMAAMAAGPSRAEDAPQVKFQPMHIGAFTEYGKIVEGSRVEAYGSDEIITDQSMDRTCAWLTEEALIGERLSVQAGISGLFWYSLPQQNGLPHTRLIKFATGVPVAQAVYSFGNVDDPFLKLHMGLFGYKYNPDAMNLGEYLFRSGTYPGYLWTGGWTLLNANNYSANGIQGAFDFLDHKLKLDVNFFIERDIEPNFDISPSVVASYNIGGFLEFGAGAEFAHLIPASAKDVTPKERANAYYFDTKRGRSMPLPQTEWDRPGLEPGDTLINASKAGTPLDPTDPRYVEGKITKYYSPDQSSADASGIPNSQLNYYTYQGVKVMGRVSLDLLRKVEMLEPGAGKLYAEVALLGVKNYPFYYEKRTERMPIMFGFNIPTFKLLDQLTVELEHYKSPFTNSVKTEFNFVYPTWDLPTDPARGITKPDPGTFLDSSMAVKGREWYWSVYARRSIVPGLSLYGQVAHDHTRVMNYYANPSYQPFVQAPKDWYWAIRLESAI